MKGKIYAVGVGPGDPELVTLKAVRLIRENEVIAFPGKAAAESAAYQIASVIIPEIAEKELVGIYMPMVHDRDVVSREHAKGVKRLEEYLSQGKNVVYLTLGDPGIYSTFTYLQELLEADGYETELIPGVTSFCAAGARAGISIAERNEPMHVIPAMDGLRENLNQLGTCVIMKSGSQMGNIKDVLINSGRRVWAVQNCGMDREMIYDGAEQIPDDAGYFTVVIVKGDKL